MKPAIIIVDHGSSRAESNQLLETVSQAFAARFAQKYEIVEPAHMEMAQPSIAAAYHRCVQRGARHIVVCPFFLGPGKHWTVDIPRLVKDAALEHPQTTCQITNVLAPDDLLLALLDKRIDETVCPAVSQK